MSNTRRIRVFFPNYYPGRPTVAFAYACGLGTEMEGGYVFVRDNSLQELREKTQHWFERVENLASSELLCYPHNFERNRSTRTIQHIARQHNLPCVFFRNVDRPGPAHLDYGTVFQESVFSSRRTTSERPHPAVVEDLLMGRALEPRSKESVPIVSFRGFPGTTGPREWLRRVKYGKEGYLGSFLRREAIEQCRRSTRVASCIDLILYDQKYRTTDSNRTISAREKYIESILNSDYVLAIRGRGNFSYRFYETLCLGRIPVILDTDITLPLDDVIDWPKHCVWIEPEDFHRIPERIREFHDSLSSESFIQLQLENRQLWEDCLEAVAFWRVTLRNLCDPGSGTLTRS